MNGEKYLKDAIEQFRKYQALAEAAIAQLPEDSFFTCLDSESNSVAIIVKHVAGNLRSRWRDFLDSDGEKPDRNRDEEFIITPADTRARLLADWGEGWRILQQTLGALRPDDLERTVKIRGEPHTVVQAINRQLSHYPYHVGQITFIAKHFCGPAWRTLSVARGQSQEFNAKKFASERSKP